MADKTRISPMMLLPPVIFLGLAAMFFFGMQRENPNELPTALAGKPAPAVTATAFEGAPVFTDAMLRDGQMKLVNFWASWCAPCRVEHPTLEALADEGIPLYGINYKDKPGNARAFLAELGNPYTAMAVDREGRMGLEWGVYGTPETFLIDGQGRIVTRIAGPVTKRILEERLRPEMERIAAGG